VSQECEECSNSGRIAAETAEEDLRNGKEPATPWWQVVNADGSLNEKFPCGNEAQAARLKEEGHSIESDKSKKPHRLKDFHKCLQKL